MLYYIYQDVISKQLFVLLCLKAVQGGTCLFMRNMQEGRCPVKRLMCLFAAVVSMSAFAADNKVAVTVYNNNRALVREIRALSIKQGISSLYFRDVAARIDPTSVYCVSRTSPDRLSIIEQNFEYDLISADKVMNKYLDKEVTLVSKEGQVYKGVLLSTAGGNLVLKTGSGIEIFSGDVLERFTLPELPEGLITRPTLVWQVDNRGPAGQDLEISYLTGGMDWHAEYIAVVAGNEKKLDLAGWVSVKNSSGTTYRNATVKLIAGDVHMVKKEQPRDIRITSASYEEKAAPQLEEKEFFEYHMYTLNRKSTLKNNQVKQISLLPSTTVSSRKTYTFDHTRFGEKIAVHLVFRNEKAAGLGIPLPKGKVRVYKKDTDGSQEFIGEDSIDHTPKDEEVKLLLGNAFDITGTRKAVSTSKVSIRSRRETYEIVLKNHKKSTVDIAVVEHIWGDWSIEDYSHRFTKQDRNTVQFDVRVKPGQTVTLSYTSLITW